MKMEERQGIVHFLVGNSSIINWEGLGVGANHEKRSGALFWALKLGL